MTQDVTSSARKGGKSTARWRTVDIVVASAVAVAFGVVFWAWGKLWNTTQPAFTGFPPAQAFMYGVWLVPGVLGALVIRKPGAAIYAELVAVDRVGAARHGLGPAASCSTAWSQGAAPELVFAFLLLPLLAAARGARSRAPPPGWRPPCWTWRSTTPTGPAAGSSTYALLLAASSVVVAGPRLLAAGAGARAHRGAGAVRLRARPGPGLTVPLPVGLRA